MVSIQNKEIYLASETNWKEENGKAIVRGAFMGSGSVNNPEKEYHLEINVSNQQNRDKLVNILQTLGICVKTFQLSIYIKEGEEISKFLALIGAGKAVIKKLQKTGKFQKLEENLKEIARLRLENPDMSLIELGKLLKEPIGKSGVNYRLKKIMEIADEK